MAEINGFIFYKSFYEAIKKVPNEYQAEIYNAIFEYVFYGKEPEELSNIAEAMYILIKPNIDSFLKKHKTSVENGKKGGRPPKNKNPEKTQKKPKGNLNKTQEKPKQNPEKTYDKEEEKEEDIEKDRDKEKEINKEKEKTTADAVVEKKANSSSCSEKELQEVLDFYESNIDLLTEYSRDTLVDYAKELPADLIILAMKKAADSKVRTMKYIKGILNNWIKAGIKTVLQAQEEEQEFRNKTEPKEETREETIARKTRELEEAMKNANK